MMERSGESTSQDVASRSSSDVAALRLEHVTKAFGRVVALRDVSLMLRPGEVLGLVGDNGAGKSTIIKILTGVHQPDRGNIEIDGRPVVLRSVSHARGLGIEAVYQDLALVDELPVYQNLFLNREVTRFGLVSRVLDHRTMRKRASAYLSDVGISIPSVETKVAVLSGGQRQAIAIARATHSDARILLLDEPLAAMGAREGRLVLDLVRRFKARGEVSIIFIAHNYMHVIEVCDRIILMRNGRIVIDKENTETSVEELTSLVTTEYRS
jgi:simple sugar transport system ATP-binding protein